MSRLQKNENKSLFLYTGLIFLVAIILIILAFFGQTNVMKSQPDTANTEVAETPSSQLDGIAQKASILSEQNSTLMSQNDTLKTQIQEKNAEISKLDETVNELSINNANGNLFCNIYQYIYNGRKDDAREALSTVNKDSLTDAQKIIYNNLESILD